MNSLRDSAAKDAAAGVSSSSLNKKPGSASAGAKRNTISTSTPSKPTASPTAATKTKGPLTPHQKLNLQPTLAHHCLALLTVKKKFFHHWVNQNHDRLAQKAGFPQPLLNEIHGGWGDKPNPVVKMGGVLRSDLFHWMEEWSEKADVVLSLGTSLSGMASDDYIPRMAAGREEREEKKKKIDEEDEFRNSGLIIVGFQPTRMDHMAQVRLWGQLDDIVLKLTKELLLGQGGDIVIPDPFLVKEGERWMRAHPSCAYDTPMRKGYKEESVREILKRTNPGEYEKRYGASKS